MAIFNSYVTNYQRVTGTNFSIAMSPLIPWAPQRTVRSTGSDCPCSWTKPMSSRKKHSLFQDSPNDKTWQNIVTACLSLSIFFVKFRCQTSGGLLMPQRRLVCLTVGYGVPWSSWSSAATGKTKSHQQGGGTSQQKCQTRIYPTRHKPLTKSHAAPLKKKSLWVKFAIIWIIYYDILKKLLFLDQHPFKRLILMLFALLVTMLLHWSSGDPTCFDMSRYLRYVADPPRDDVLWY